MDIAQLLKDIFTFKLSSHIVRLYKLNALVKRKLLSENKYSQSTNYFQIPIIINNRNRLTYLKKEIKWLTNSGYTNMPAHAARGTWRDPADPAPRTGGRGRAPSLSRPICRRHR